MGDDNYCEYNIAHCPASQNLSFEDSGNRHVCTYEITYTDNNMVPHTELIDATHVHTDGPLVELWDGDDLILGVQEDAVQQIRNVSRLDMRDNR